MNSDENAEKRMERRDFLRGAAAVGTALAAPGALAGYAQGAKPIKGAMTRQQYLEYADHFNNKRYDAVTSYFTPDVTVEYYDNASGPQTQARTLYGPQAFIDSYRKLHETTREVLELRDFLSTEDRVFTELYTEFHTIKEVPAPQGGMANKVGDVRIAINWVLYDMVGGKMKRIRIAHWRNLDPKMAKYKNSLP
jgi:hypothetical protein